MLVTSLAVILYLLLYILFYNYILAVTEMRTFMKECREGNMRISTIK